MRAASVHVASPRPADSATATASSTSSTFVGPRSPGSSRAWRRHATPTRRLP